MKNPSLHAVKGFFYKLLEQDLPLDKSSEIDNSGSSY